MSSEEFNADEFLNGITEGWRNLPRVAPSGNPISQPYKNPPPLQVPITDTEILYHCPLDESEALQKKKRLTKYEKWQYYKCPVARCFVICDVECVEYYIDFTIPQLHEVYLENELDKMRFYCERPLIMSQSRSEKNPGRLFFKCPKRNCKSFLWVDQEPRGITKAWIGREQNPGGVPRTPKVVHTPAKKLRHEKGRNSRKRRKTTRERTSVYREIEKWES